MRSSACWATGIYWPDLLLHDILESLTVTLCNQWWQKLPPWKPDFDPLSQSADCRQEARSLKIQLWKKEGVQLANAVYPGHPGHHRACRLMSGV